MMVGRRNAKDAVRVEHDQIFGVAFGQVSDRIDANRKVCARLGRFGFHHDVRQVVTGFYRCEAPGFYGLLTQHDRGTFGFAFHKGNRVAVDHEVDGGSGGLRGIDAESSRPASEKQPPETARLRRGAKGLHDDGVEFVQRGRRDADELRAFNQALEMGLELIEAVFPTQQCFEYAVAPMDQMIIDWNLHAARIGDDRIPIAGVHGMVRVGVGGGAQVGGPVVKCPEIRHTAKMPCHLRRGKGAVSSFRMEIREALATELEQSLEVERAAFGGDEGANLVYLLSQDPDAQPCLSLLAFDNDEAVGHVLFSPVGLEGAEAWILCPLAVVPSRQKQGVGSALIREGLKRLCERGVDLVFVLGDPAYYPRSGFQPAYPHGLQAPYPYTVEQQPAWMVQELHAGVLGSVKGTVAVCETLQPTELWEF